MQNLGETPEEREARLLAEAEAELEIEQKHEFQEQIAAKREEDREASISRIGRVIATIGRFIYPRM